MRSAYFLGVDAVAISTHSAPLGPVALKASAGSSESIPLLSVRATGTFIQQSQKYGWKFFAAVAPPSHVKTGTNSDIPVKEHFSTSLLRDPLRTSPCVVMLGGEGTGLKTDLQRKADFTLSIEGHRNGSGGVDSLNVSVAAGLLCDAFMRPPAANMPQEKKKEVAGDALF